MVEDVEEKDPMINVICAGYTGDTGRAGNSFVKPRGQGFRSGNQGRPEQREMSVEQASITNLL